MYDCSTTIMLIILRAIDSIASTAWFPCDCQFDGRFHCAISTSSYNPRLVGITVGCCLRSSQPSTVQNTLAIDWLLATRDCVLLLTNLPQLKIYSPVASSSAHKFLPKQEGGNTPLTVDPKRINSQYYAYAQESFFMSYIETADRVWKSWRVAYLASRSF